MAERDRSEESDHDQDLDPTILRTPKKIKPLPQLKTFASFKVNKKSTQSSFFRKMSSTID